MRAERISCVADHPPTKTGNSRVHVSCHGGTCSLHYHILPSAGKLLPEATWVMNQPLKFVLAINCTSAHPLAAAAHALTSREPAWICHASSCPFNTKRQRGEARLIAIGPQRKGVGGDPKCYPNCYPIAAQPKDSRCETSSNIGAILLSVTHPLPISGLSIQWLRVRVPSASLGQSLSSAMICGVFRGLLFDAG